MRQSDHPAVVYGLADGGVGKVVDPLGLREVIEIFVGHKGVYIGPAKAEYEVRSLPAALKSERRHFFKLSYRQRHYFYPVAGKILITFESAHDVRPFQTGIPPPYGKRTPVKLVPAVSGLKRNWRLRLFHHLPRLATG
ncbi:MAG: hypothetical protein LUE09_01745 [Synergistaceae bacterium]|nr:hypothetical protein [Synergistaceae bacterium]